MCVASSWQLYRTIVRSDAARVLRSSKMKTLPVMGPYRSSLSGALLLSFQWGFRRVQLTPTCCRVMLLSYAYLTAGTRVSRLLCRKHNNARCVTQRAFRSPQEPVDVSHVHYQLTCHLCKWGRRWKTLCGEYLPKIAW